MAALISAKELAARLGEAGLAIVDCRYDLADAAAGERAFAAGHIPGARFAHLDRDLSDLGRRGHGRHPLPEANRFAAFLAAQGIPPDARMVVYDQDLGQYAARLWWMCRAIGMPEPLLLDGGFAAWKAADLPVVRGWSTARPLPPWTCSYTPGAVVESPELELLLARREILLLDARAAARFRGELEPIDRVAGHVPGARIRPFTENLEGGRFKDPERLRAEFRALIGDRDPRTVVHMCGSGVTACHNLFAMELAGLPGSRLYADSWSGWISDPRRPVARGLG